MIYINIIGRGWCSIAVLWISNPIVIAIQVSRSTHCSTLQLSPRFFAILMIVPRYLQSGRSEVIREVEILSPFILYCHRLHNSTLLISTTGSVLRNIPIGLDPLTQPRSTAIHDNLGPSYVHIDKNTIARSRLLHIQSSSKTHNALAIHSAPKPPNKIKLSVSILHSERMSEAT